MSINSWVVGENGMPDSTRPPHQGGIDYQDIWEDHSSRQPLKIGIIATVIFHLFLFFIVFPKSRGPVYSEKDVWIDLRFLAPSPAPAEKEGVRNIKQAAKKTPTKVTAKVFIPFPDPTPDAPEPLTMVIPEKLTVVVEEINEVVEVGEITGPSSTDTGGDKGRQGAGPGAQTGPGGTGQSIYREGDGGVTPPALLAKELPLYTEEARRKRVQGLVILKAIIDKNGRVTDVQIIKSLDSELDESAVQTVVTKWRFRPATLDGQPVLFEIKIEVEFGLY